MISRKDFLVFVWVYVFAFGILIILATDMWGEPVKGEYNRQYYELLKVYTNDFDFIVNSPNNFCTNWTYVFHFDSIWQKSQVTVDYLNATKDERESFELESVKFEYHNNHFRCVITIEEGQLRSSILGRDKGQYKEVTIALPFARLTS